MKCSIITIFLIICVGTSQFLGAEEFDVESVEMNETTTFYTAAVVEMNAKGDSLSDPYEIVQYNLAEYLKWIRKANKNSVDMLVFPEATLNYNGINTRNELKQTSVDLPLIIPDTSDCDYSYDIILSALSMAISNASLYALVNIVEAENCNDMEKCSPDGFNLYNTNIVFDRNGCIISRYRKFNLFIEPNMNVTEKPELAIFETDFGVTFGHFVCFDIMFKTPAMNIFNLNVSHILYPSMWFSELPFATSTQIQQNFAFANNIVLLSAGANAPSVGSTGSGIFIGRHGAVDLLISPRNESRMIVAEVPKNVSDEDYEPPVPSLKPSTPAEMDMLHLSSYNPTLTFSLQDYIIMQQDGIECEISVNFTTLEIPDGYVGYLYRFVFFSGRRHYANIVDAGEIQCAIIACTNDATCGRRFDSSTNLVPSVKFHSITVKASLNATGDPEDYLITPTSLDTSIVPLSVADFEFEARDEHFYAIKSTKEINNLMTFGIYGRNFNLDKKLPQNIEKRESTDMNIQNAKTISHPDDDDYDLVCKMTIYVGLMISLGTVTAIMVYRKLQHPFIKRDPNKTRRSLK